MVNKKITSIDDLSAKDFRSIADQAIKFKKSLKNFVSKKYRLPNRQQYPSTYYIDGSIYLGKENGVLLGFSVGIICVTFACWKLYIDDWRDDED